MLTPEEHTVALLKLAVPSPIFRDTEPISLAWFHNGNWRLNKNTHYTDLPKRGTRQGVEHRVCVLCGCSVLLLLYTRELVIYSPYVYHQYFWHIIQFLYSFFILFFIVLYSLFFFKFIFFMTSISFFLSNNIFCVWLIIVNERLVMHRKGQCFLWFEDYFLPPYHFILAFFVLFHFRLFVLFFILKNIHVH